MVDGSTGFLEMDDKMRIVGEKEQCDDCEEKYISQIHDMNAIDEDS